jgi:hypothetical protein
VVYALTTKQFVLPSAFVSVQVCATRMTVLVVPLLTVAVRMAYHASEVVARLFVIIKLTILYTMHLSEPAFPRPKNLWAYLAQTANVLMASHLSLGLQGRVLCGTSPSLILSLHHICMLHHRTHAALPKLQHPGKTKNMLNYL